MSDSILPRSSAPTEHALDDAVAQAFKLPVPIRTLWRPRETPEPLLPWVAWGFGVDIWDETWTATTKRQVIEESFSLHRKKGTLAGIKRYVELAGGEVLRAIVPPQATILGRTWTIEERRRFLARYPQLRIKPYRQPVISHGFFLDHGALTQDGVWYDNAAAYTGPRAYLYDQGEERPLTLLERRRVDAVGNAVDYYEVRLGAKSLDATVCGGPSQYLTRFAGNERIFSIAKPQNYQDVRIALDMQTVLPSLDPISYIPEQVAERVVAHGFPLNQAAPRSDALGRPRAEDHLYQRWYLLDPDRPFDAPQHVDTGAYLGSTRLGMKPYTAELEIAAYEAGVGQSAIGQPPGAPLGQPSLNRLWRICDAVETAQSLRDQILLDTTTYSTVKAGERYKAGSVIAGEQRRDF